MESERSCRGSEIKIELLPSLPLFPPSSKGNRKREGKEEGIGRLSQPRCAALSHSPFLLLPLNACLSQSPSLFSSLSPCFLLLLSSVGGKMEGTREREGEKGRDITRTDGIDAEDTRRGGSVPIQGR